MNVALVARGCMTVPLSLPQLDSKPELVREGIDGVIAVGGDGTVRSVASIVQGTGVPLGIMPTGTENLAARAFGFRRPTAVLAPLLADAVLAGRGRSVDLGAVRAGDAPERVFLIMLSVGFDAEVVARLHAVRRGRIRHTSYAWPILATAARWRAPRCTVAVDGRGILDAHGTLVVANACEYALRLNPARGADPSDGLLDGVRVPGRTAPAVALAALRLLLARAGTAAPLPAFRGNAFDVQLDRPSFLQADGDPVPGGRVRGFSVRVLRGALRLLEPDAAGPGASAG